MSKQGLPARLQGVVTRFKGNGRQLGYPTANLSVDTTLADGVYFGFADLGGYKNHPALVFVGTPITVGDTERRVEAHLLDIADRDYYGLRLTLHVQHFHRPNRRLGSVDALVTIMRADEATARHWFELASDS